MKPRLKVWRAFRVLLQHSMSIAMLVSMWPSVRANAKAAVAGDDALGQFYTTADKVFDDLITALK